MKKVTLFLILFTTVASSFAQIEKQNISIDMIKGSEDYSFREQLTQGLTSRIVASKRFNVVDHTHTATLMKEKVRQLKGISSETDAIKAGQILGFSKMIYGKLNKIITVYHKEKRNDKGKVTQKAYYSAKSTASIYMINVGDQNTEAAFEGNGNGKGSNEKYAKSNAIKSLINNIYKKFEKSFIIVAKISGTKKTIITLNAGSNSGVKKGMDFYVYSMLYNDRAKYDVSQKHIAIIRVTKVTNNSSEAAIFDGSFSDVKTGQMVRESKEKIALKLSIAKRKGLSTVILTGGKNMGVKEHDRYSVIKATDTIYNPIDGSVIDVKKEELGLIVVQNVYDAFAEAKVVEGRYRHLENKIVRETKKSFLRGGFGLHTSISPLTIKANTQHFGDEYKDINSVLDVGFNTYMHNILDNYSMGVCIDRISGGDLSAWSFMTDASYYLGIVPEIIYIVPEVGLGYGSSTQKIPNDLINKYDSRSDKDEVQSNAFSAKAGINAIFKISKLMLSVSAKYRMLKFEEWKYTYKTGETDENGKDKTDTEKLPNENIPYSNLDLTGLYFGAGISFEF